MRTQLEQKLLRSIQNTGAIRPGGKLAVAVSGGADSVALLRILDTLANELGITLLVAHLNHQLRGAESDADASFVESLAKKRGLQLVQHVEDVGALAAQKGWNLEDAGRRVRQQFFERIVGQGAADWVAVAHTADDQAETVLAHLMRGTGPTGLGGIYLIAGPVIRPLLEFRRQDLREYLRSLKQEWREDSTNDDTRRTRARIRKNLLPLIEREFSPAIVEHLGDLARLVREEQQFWDAFIERQFQNLVRDTAGGLKIATDHLLRPVQMEAPDNPAGIASTSFGGAQAALRPVTERLIRRIYEAVKGDRRELSAKHVEKIIQLACAVESGHSAELPGGIYVRREFADLLFARRATGRTERNAKETPGRAHSYEYVVDLALREDTTVVVAELGKRLSLNLIDWPCAQSDTIRDSQALDADLLRSPLILRNWRPGDSYRPCGRRAEHKLKEMLLAARIPRVERGSWPVLESKGQVVWALRVTPADEYSAKTNTRKALVIREEQG